MTLHCICCDKELEAVDPTHAPYQPWAAIIASSFGNFGSTAFDSMQGEEELHFFVCDDCLRKRTHRIYVWKHTKSVLQPADASTF